MAKTAYYEIEDQLLQLLTWRKLFCRNMDLHWFCCGSSLWRLSEWRWCKCSLSLPPVSVWSAMSIFPHPLTSTLLTLHTNQPTTLPTCTTLYHGHKVNRSQHTLRKGESWAHLCYWDTLRFWISSEIFWLERRWRCLRQCISVHRVVSECSQGRDVQLTASGFTFSWVTCVGE